MGTRRSQDTDRRRTRQLFREHVLEAPEDGYSGEQSEECREGAGYQTYGRAWIYEENDYIGQGDSQGRQKRARRKKGTCFTGGMQCETATRQKVSASYLIVEMGWVRARLLEDQRRRGGDRPRWQMGKLTTALWLAWAGVRGDRRRVWGTCEGGTFGVLFSGYQGLNLGRI